MYFQNSNNNFEKGKSSKNISTNKYCSVIIINMFINVPAISIKYHRLIQRYTFPELPSQQTVQTNGRTVSSGKRTTDTAAAANKTHAHRDTYYYYRFLTKGWGGRVTKRRWRYNAGNAGTTLHNIFIVSASFF